MIAQYLEVKAKHPDFLLFYRMGDFFELFFDDAVKAAEALGIALTKRGKHRGEDIPMCGVPVARADDYLQKLIRKGFRVAVAEQLEDPEAARKRGPKAVVLRDIVRLVTPGTLTEDALLVPANNNFLSAIARAGKAGSPRYCLASIDLSTGEFLVGEAEANDLEGEILKLRPAEIIVPEDELSDPLIKQAGEMAEASISALGRVSFHKGKGERALKEAFGVAALEGFGAFTDGEFAVVGALLHYIDVTQMGERPALRPPKRKGPSASLAIDAASRASLELVRPRNEGAPTLFSAIDRTVTAAGARELMNRLLSPLTDPAQINERLDDVSFLAGDFAFRERVRKILKAAPDMSRSLSRLKLKRGGPRDLGVIRDGLQAAAALKTLLDEAPALPRGLAAIGEALSGPEKGSCAALPAMLKQALAETLPFSARDGGFIAKGYDGRLEELKQLATDTRSVLARLQAEYIARTGVKTLKIQYNQLFGYFVEVGPSSAAILQAEPHASVFSHRQTLANSVRFTTAELAVLQEKIVNATSEALVRELHLFDELAAAIVDAEGAIFGAAAALASLDCTSALAELAQTNSYARPKVDASRCFMVEGGRHPSVEQALSRQGAAFIGNDCKLDADGDRAPGFLVVTGPNMAGKSTYLRQNALIAVLAQMGSFVPASSAHIGVADRLYARIGAADDLARGRSTFMVEMSETAAMLNQASARSLVILDEIGRGTATFDGLSIAWAVLEHLHDTIRCRGLLATHFHELTRLADSLPRA